MRIKKLSIKYFLFILLLFASNITLNSNANSKNVSTVSNVIFDSEAESNLGPLNIPYYSMAVTGDSYAGLFCDFEGGKDFNISGYAIAGRTIVENKLIMASAMNSENKFVLVSIGVNDHFNNTTPYVFESTLRGLLNIATIFNKYVFFHSYVDYPASALMPKKFGTDTYDQIIKKVVKEYKNAYYIDMLDCQGEQYISEDNIHYNIEFYDILYSRLLKVIRSIDFT